MNSTETKLRKLPFIDILVEDKSFTLLFEGEKILMINEFEGNEFMYSFFIDRVLISSNVIENLDLFIKNFIDYLNLN